MSNWRLSGICRTSTELCRWWLAADMSSDRQENSLEKLHQKGTDELRAHLPGVTSPGEMICPDMSSGHLHPELIQMSKWKICSMPQRTDPPENSVLRCHGESGWPADSERPWRQEKGSREPNPSKVDPALAPAQRGEGEARCTRIRTTFTSRPRMPSARLRWLGGRTGAGARHPFPTELHRWPTSGEGHRPRRKTGVKAPEHQNPKRVFGLVRDNPPADSATFKKSPPNLRTRDEREPTVASSGPVLCCTGPLRKGKAG
jgi:hypothetical protein